jgi:hypothetical protein
MRRLAGWFRRDGDLILLACCYSLFALAGALALFAFPSPSLLSQGGRVIVDVWALFCLVGGIAGVVGLVLPRPQVEAGGVIFLSSASLTWTVSLILQAVSAGTVIPLTAAAIAGALTAKLAHRVLVVVRRRDR